MGRTISEALRQTVLLFDGAMGTQIQKRSPSSADFPDGKDGFNDGLVLSHPEWIRDIHRSYLEAGADCIETNTFGSNKIKLDEYGFGADTIKMNAEAARLAADAASEFGADRYVVGTMGPTGFLPSSTDPELGSISLDTISEAYELQARGLLEGGVHALLIETSQDILEVKMAIEGARRAMKKIRHIPLIANITLDPYGRMLLGTDVQAAYTILSAMRIDVFGLNCSTGPAEMLPSIRWLDSQNHDLLVVPNAGMPENEGGRAIYKMSPEKMADIMAQILSAHRRVRIIGGCCGTEPGHIARLRKVIDAHSS